MTVINTRKKGGKNPSNNFHSESCESCLTVDAAAMIGCQPHCSRTSLHVTTSTNLLVRMPHLHFLSILFFFIFPPTAYITLISPFRFNHFASSHHFRLPEFVGVSQAGNLPLGTCNLSSFCFYHCYYFFRGVQR